MKKMVILLLALFLFTGCGKIQDESISDHSESDNSVSSAVDLEQESDTIIMFYHECYSESTVVNAKMMTFDGKIFDVTDYVYKENRHRDENWIKKIPDVLNEAKAKTIMPENDIQAVHDFLASDPSSFGNDTKQFGATEHDIGINYLTLLKKSENGAYSELLLCRSGEVNECLDNDIVFDFCNLMSEKGYYCMIY